MNNSDDSTNSQDAGVAGEQPEAHEETNLAQLGSFHWEKLFRIFLVRIPLWLVAVLMLVIGGWIGYTRFTSEDPVSLRPAILDAKKVDITIVTCDDQIDKRNLDIRKEELKLIEKLEDIEKVGYAEVRIDRDDKLCSDSAGN